jgi:hypothetical protein
MSEKTYCYVSKMIGSGTEDDPYRPAISRYSSKFSIDPHPGGEWCLGTTKIDDIAGAAADIDMAFFPLTRLGDLVSTLPVVNVTALKSKVDEITGDATPALKDTTTLASVWDYLGQLINPDFNLMDRV